MWPLSYKELLINYKKIDRKFKFNLNNLQKKEIELPFETRLFYAPRNPLRVKKFYKNKNFDIIYNCKVDLINETKNSVELFINKKKKYFKIDVKNLIICAGGIESTALILKSIKNGKLKNLKNKKYVGRYFMDHPKGNVGYLKFPKKKLLSDISLKIRNKYLSYYGFSIKKRDQISKKYLNTYVRFEEVNNNVEKILKIFGEKINRIFNNNYKKTYQIRVFLEMQPDFKNFLSINKKNKIVINIKYGNKEIETLNFLLKEVYNFFSEKPKLEKINLFNKRNLNLMDASHHMGGLIYPKIVNKNLKLNGTKNIYCCSSAIFPTSGSLNPTFTICALALRLGNYLS